MTDSPTAPSGPPAPPPLVLNATLIQTGIGQAGDGTPAALINLHNSVAVATIALVPEHLDAVIASLIAIAKQLRGGPELVIAADVPMRAAEMERVARQAGDAAAAPNGVGPRW